MTMKNKQIMAMAAIAAVAVISTRCAKGNDPDVSKQAVEIRLSSELSAQTRGAYPAADTRIPEGQEVAVYVDKAGGTQLYGINVLNAGSGGSLTGGTTMYFPDDENAVNIYAFHTNPTLSGASYPVTSLTHTVLTDQTSAANYALSDLLYAKETGVAKTATPVTLHFSHLLSKVQIAVKAGNGDPVLTGATITIEGTKTAVTFTPDKNADAPVITAADLGVIASITLASDLNAGDISTDFTEELVRYHDAIIVPQEVSGNFIKITLADNQELFYNLQAPVTFLSGKKYIYEITVNKTGLTVTSEITDWQGGDTTTGSITF